VDIVIDLENPEPPFAQLIAQIKDAVVGGRLQPGDALPSIRQLAGDLDLNHKTVAKAYRRLERDAVIQSRGYRGTFVHPDAEANSAVDLAGWVEEELARSIATFRDAGVTDAEIRNVFQHLMSERHP